MSAASSQGLEEAAFDIVIERPFKVGARMEVSAKTIDEHTTRFQAKGREATERTTKKTARLQATEVIQAVDAEGTATAATFTIQEAELRLPGEDDTQPALAPGTVVKATRPGPRMTFSVADAEARPQEHAFLEMVVSLPLASADPSEEEVFGSEKKRRVGEQWPIDPARFKTFFTQTAQPPFDFTVKEGAVTLAKQGPFHGVECLFLQAKVHLALGAIPQVPKTATYKMRTMTLHYTLILPQDTQRARMGESLNVLSEVAWSANLRGTEVETSMQHTQNYEATFLPALAQRAD